MVNEHKIVEKLRDQMDRLGYFVTGYRLPKRIGEIAPVAFTRPELGQCVIVAETSEEEYRREWKRDAPGRNLYRAVIE